MTATRKSAAYTKGVRKAENDYALWYWSLSWLQRWRWRRMLRRV